MPLVFTLPPFMAVVPDPVENDVSVVELPIGPPNVIVPVVPIVAEPGPLSELENEIALPPAAPRSASPVRPTGSANVWAPFVKTPGPSVVEPGPSVASDERNVLPPTMPAKAVTPDDSTVSAVAPLTVLWKDAPPGAVRVFEAPCRVTASL